MMPRNPNTAIFVESYQRGESLKKIAARFGVCAQTVLAHLRREGVKTRSLEEAIRKEPIDVGAFTQPLTVADAYWLGMLYADGNLHVVKRTGTDLVQLTAHSDDEETIVGFLGHLGLTGPLNRRKDKRAIQTLVTSKTLGKSLRVLGLAPRKTHLMRYPDCLAPALDSAFVRGYFDGDGSVGFYKKARYKTPQGRLAFTGSPQFISDIASKIGEHTGLGVSGTSRKRGGRTITIGYEGRHHLAALRAWLYRDGGPHLSRKRRILDDGLAVAGEIRAGQQTRR